MDKERWMCHWILTFFVAPYDWHGFAHISLCKLSLVPWAETLGIAYFLCLVTFSSFYHFFYLPLASKKGLLQVKKAPATDDFAHREPVPVARSWHLSVSFIYWKKRFTKYLCAVSTEILFIKHRFISIGNLLILIWNDLDQLNHIWIRHGNHIRDIRKIKTTQSLALAQSASSAISGTHNFQLISPMRVFDG